MEQISTPDLLQRIESDLNELLTRIPMLSEAVPVYKKTALEYLNRISFISQTLENEVYIAYNKDD